MNIFLLRGLVREKEHWGEFKSIVQKQFPDATIVTPEIQGVGEYVDITSPDNFSEMIEFMRSKNSKYFESGEDNILLAMSLGGMITRQWIELYPHDFKKIILVNTSFKGLNPLFHRLKPAGLMNFMRIFFSPGTEARERSIVQMVSNNEENHKKIISEWVEIQKKRPVKRASFINQIKAALTFSPPQTWPQDLPLLILSGKKDRLCSYKSSVKIHETWGGEFELHPTAGHDIPIDDSQWLMDKVSQWLQKQ